MKPQQVLHTNPPSGSLREFRVYSHKELAVMFFPHHNPRQASRSFTNLLHSDSELIEQLTLHGWKPGKRLLSPAQVGVIAQYLGHPELFVEICEQA